MKVLPLSEAIMSGWRSRGYLPHWEAGEVAQSITFRLADSLPTEAILQLEQELRLTPQEDASTERRKRIEHMLDAGHGAMWMGQPAIAEVVERALLHFDGERYKLHAWVIMPNHVHALATLLNDSTLASITHSWKSFSATGANRILGREGAFWSREYFDRAIRDEAHFANVVTYIEMNPVKANFCKLPENWRFSSASKRHPGSAGF
jgi:putative DNA methylase